ncbi:MAG: site-specific integrase [Actinobacteria bacterium]|nr:site-specific integrase [Actinomycetota bacterium]
MATRRRFGAVRRLPSGRWQARYWDGAGARIGAPTTFANKGDAQRWLSAAETDMGRGDWHDPRLGQVPFGEWADQWLAVKTPHLQESTADLYRYLLRCYLLPRFGLIPVGRITTVDIAAWLADLHDTHLSPNTVAKAYRLLKGVMGGATDAGLIARSPCTIKGAGTEREEEMRIATPEQVTALATAVGPRWEAIVFAAAYSGLRWGELAGLRRRDINFVTHTITVTRKLGEVNGSLSFSTPKTPAGRRTVGIPSFVAGSLAMHIDLYALAGEDGLVFPSAEGMVMRRSNFRRRVWEPATATVGMTGFRFHDLRHTASTLAAASGTSLRALMARIGHASARAALRYQHVLDGQDADIVRYLEQFGEAPPAPTHAQEAPPLVGTRWARKLQDAATSEDPQAPEQDLCGGDDGTRTHDPLPAKQMSVFV